MLRSELCQKQVHLRDVPGENNQSAFFLGSFKGCVALSVLGVSGIPSFIEQKGLLFKFSFV